MNHPMGVIFIGTDRMRHIHLIPVFTSRIEIEQTAQRIYFTVSYLPPRPGQTFYDKTGAAVDRA